MQKSSGFEGELIIEIPKMVVNTIKALPLIQYLYITRMGFYPKALHHYYQRPQGISETILIYCTHGKGWIKIQNDIVGVSAGEIFVIPKNIPHSYGADAQNPWTIYWFHLEGNNTNDATKAIMNNVSQSVQVGFSDERNELFKQIANTLLKGYSTTNLLFANLTLPYYLSTFISPEFFQKINDKNQPASSTDKAIKFMQENLSNTLTLDDIAQSAHLSISFFSRKFKEDTGYAPIEYFNHLRVQKACQLLHFSTLRINEVASEIGIDDPFYFSRLFKQQMGVSPVQYRKGESNN
ncbi:MULTISPECIES: AraC family transcriptional regulator [unclassified Arcicella]|uniref:AraC family transcriptional regulator n=1 Tax=unclassified Arcicella TaxID=2644986 RepID=UPI0028554D2D|nr:MULTISPECIES: AraC family transcriptional regulator [unclassified Arcicella]MDR6562292.1 AraC-like DNA-binding protein [Arcicella sp. BE51]MDR6812013.1 AraC-like DNA-binding protein [Arcicella sp. BE140]MDR6823324.1 AraC-like DNA-binding protein [Arcicella sp. BE139]